MWQVLKVVRHGVGHTLGYATVLLHPVVVEHGDELLKGFAETGDVNCIWKAKRERQQIQAVRLKAEQSK